MSESLAFEPLEGKYEILAKMREGGMGAVYKVRHRLLDDVRVVKVMRPQLAQDEVLKERFLREAKTAVRLRHPNLAQIFDFAVDEEGTAFIVMEFIDGVSLQDLVKILGRPSIALVLEIASQALDVLGYLHRMEVVHRDIAPDNLLLTRDEELHPQVKVIDLGIAKGPDMGGGLTRTGTFVGKLRYCSPEHFQTQQGSRVDGRSDLYSFGIVLYELASGVYPIRGTSTSGLISGHLVKPPLGFEESDPDRAVPDDLRWIILKALEKKPEGRYQTAEEFREDILVVQERFPLAAAELERAFAVPVLKPAAEARPGSTQGRLDRNFLLAPTPPPVSVVEPEPATPPSFATADGASPETGVALDQEAGRQAELRAKRVTERLATARTLMQEESFEDAAEAIAQALEADPDNAEAHALLTEAQRLLKEQDANRRRALQIAETTAAIASNIEKRELDEAQQALELARKVYGSEAPFATLEEELAKARRRVTEERLEATRQQAAELISACRFGEAIEKLQAVRAEAPGDSSTEELIAAAEEGIRRVEEESRRAQLIQQAVRGIDNLILAGRFETAYRTITSTVNNLGEFEAAKQLRTRVEREVAEHRRREKQAWTLLGRARSLAEHGKFQAAEATLDEARAFEPDCPEVHDLLEETDRAIRELAEEQRRRQVLAEAVASIEKTVDRGALDDALHEVEVAERLCGSQEVFAALRQRVEELQRAQRQARVEVLLREALGKQASFEEVIARLEEALTLDPTNPRVQRLLAETRGALLRYDQERRAAAIAEVMAEVDALILAGSFELALDRVNQSVETLGEFREARTLRHRLQGATAQR